MHISLTAGLIIGAKTTTASSRHSATGTGSAVADASLFPAVRSLEKPTARLDTGEKFLSWLHSMEDSLRSRDDEPYRVYMEQLERHRDDADQLLKKVSFQILFCLGCVVHLKNVRLPTSR